MHVTFKRHMSAIEQGLGAENKELLQQVRLGLYCNFCKGCARVCRWS